MTFILNDSEKKLVKYIARGKKRFRLFNGIYRIRDCYVALLSKRLCLPYRTVQSYVCDFKNKGLVYYKSRNLLGLTESGLRICKVINQYSQQNEYLKFLRKMSEGLEACIYNAGCQDEVNYAELNYYNAQYELIGELVEEFELLSAAELVGRM